MKEVIRQLLYRLNIRTGNSDNVYSCPINNKILNALTTKTNVTIVDVEYSGTRWLVLGSLVDNPYSHYPLLIKAHLHKNPDLNVNWGCHCKVTLPKLQERNWLDKVDKLETKDVAQFFTDGFMSSHLIPVYREDVWIVSGDLPEDCYNLYKESIRSYTYFDAIDSVYDLNEVKINDSIFMIDEDSTLWLFTKLESNRWEVTIVPDVCWPTIDNNKHFMVLFEGAMIGLKTKGYI